MTKNFQNSDVIWLDYVDSTNEEIKRDLVSFNIDKYKIKIINLGFDDFIFYKHNEKDIKEHKKVNSFLQVTVKFVGEVITCIRDKDKKIVTGDPEKIKKIYDTWVFSRDTTSQNPNWQLVEILT